MEKRVGDVLWIICTLPIPQRDTKEVCDFVGSLSKDHNEFATLDQVAEARRLVKKHSPQAHA